MHHTYFASFALVILSLITVDAHNRTVRQATTVCSPEQVNDVLSCYARYLAQYNEVLEQDGARTVLPQFSRLYYHMQQQSLGRICQLWGTLTTCLAPISLLCINIPVFQRISWTNVQGIEYLQNHAFFEYACGAGNAQFMANERCLSTAFTASPFTRRLIDCGGRSPQVQDPGFLCVNAQSANKCIKDSMARECGESAAIGVCHASTNIARRAAEVEPMCLLDMDLTCSTAHLSILLPILLLIALIYQRS